MISCNILHSDSLLPLHPDKITIEISKYWESNKDTIRDIIQSSNVLDSEGEVFCECASILLSNFGMKRRGPFHGDSKAKLLDCWQKIGSNLLEINQLVRNSGLSRDRFLVDIGDSQRDDVISKVWFMTKELLPLTMGAYTNGLVGASKILFSVLPEIVLPVDNNQWSKLFKTVDLGDVIRFMAKDIQNWEAKTNKHLNDLDASRRLSTLPSIYNVIAMSARPLG